MEDELKAMREEIAKLRERVAVLEARSAWQYNPTGPSLLQKYLQSPVASNNHSVQGNVAFVTGSMPPDTITC